MPLAKITRSTSDTELSKFEKDKEKIKRKQDKKKETGPWNETKLEKKGQEKTRPR